MISSARIQKRFAKLYENGNLIRGKVRLKSANQIIRRRHGTDKMKSASLLAKSIALFAVTFGISISFVLLNQQNPSLIKPDPMARSFVLWLHGLGDSGPANEPIKSLFTSPEFRNTKWAFPSAPSNPVTCNFIYGGMSAFNLYIRSSDISSVLALEDGFSFKVLHRSELSTSVDHHLYELGSAVLTAGCGEGPSSQELCGVTPDRNRLKFLERGPAPSHGGAPLLDHHQSTPFLKIIGEAGAHPPLDSPKDEGGILKAVQNVHAMIDKEIAAGTNPNNVFVCGFSQGGALTLASVLLYPKTLGGGAVFSGWVPFNSTILERVTSDAKRTPILWSHGMADRTVLFEAGQAGPPFLEKAGLSCEFKAYPGLGHSINNEELSSLGSWIKSRLQSSS
ncbi:hypothetical protein BUALT_Bualt03G0082900 [Buddleja alternifolia]|uniref:Phospholipase/carboxylesterase/thioesterase domain-containing protein n=1 Tax=Buddleja alternifolia TaxID=168488 RepID=A0AAV6Y3A6_9LAMI|nr:hypothetical protein BUALT_Bualt03G0082900 [Buddleja alternifolia]